MGNAFGAASGMLTAAEEAALAADNIRAGTPWHNAVPAAALRTGGRLAAAQAGARAGFRAPLPLPGKIVAGAAVGTLGGVLGDQLPSSEAIADGLLNVGREYGRNPFYGLP